MGFVLEQKVVKKTDLDFSFKKPQQKQFVLFPPRRDCDRKRLLMFVRGSP